MGSMVASRRWIYVCNGLMVCLLSIFGVIAWQVLGHQWMSLFPFGYDDPGLVYMYVACGVQLVTCLLGFVSVHYSRKWLLRIYFSAMIILVVGDVVIGLVWAFKLRNLHLIYRQHLTGLFNHSSTSHNSLYFCPLWLDVEKTLECCGVSGPSDYGAINGSCIADSSLPCRAKTEEDLAKQVGCLHPLLNWLHEKADLLFIVGYCLLFILKLVFVFILRREMNEIFLDIFYGRNKHMFAHWASEDAPECDRTVPNDSQYEDTISGLNQLTIAEAPPKKTKRLSIIRQINKAAESSIPEQKSQLLTPGGHVRFQIETVNEAKS